LSDPENFKDEGILLRYAPNGVLFDREIAALSNIDDVASPLVHPCLKGVKSERGTISSGLTSCGYDVRLGTRFKRVRSNRHTIIDPKNIPDDLFEDFVAGSETDDGDLDIEPVFVPPHSYLLGVSYEKINMPKNVSALCVGKSTYARCGLLINTTPLEPGWSGHITIEIANLESIPVRIYPMEGIMQVIFFSRNTVPDEDYSSRNGKYQNQEAIPAAPR
jgi:dCTP deaminase